MGEMTSRERVMMALAHREPDRVPFDCQFGWGAYNRLRDHLGYRPAREVLPGSPGLTVRLPVDLMQQLNIDLYFVGLYAGSQTTPFEAGMPSYVDEWGIGYRRLDGAYGFSYEAVEHPLAGAGIDDLADYPWPDPRDPARVAGLAERCRALYEDTDFALVGRFNTPIFEQAFMLRGFEQFLLDTALDPDFACALLDKTAEIAVGMLEAGFEACGRYIQIIRLAGDDMGHQQGTILSPRMFRSLIKPRFARLYRRARDLLDGVNPGGKIMAHTDGDVYALIPDYIEMGLDVLNPVQPHVTNMDHTRLKREFGDRLSFHAAIDIQRLMPFGTPEEVKQGAGATMRTLGPGGGYILAPTHYLQPDVPPENIIALRDAVLEHGHYPL